METSRDKDRLELILKATGVGLYHFEAKTGSFTVDDTVRDLFDLDPDEEFGMELMASRIHADDLEAYWEAAQESMRTGQFAHDYRVVHRNGTVRWVSGRSSVALGEDGTPEAIDGICVDVTERYALETRLQQTESRLQNVADSVPGLLAYIDKDYVLRFLSKEYDNWMGRSREEMLDKSVEEALGPEVAAKRRETWQKVFAGETVQVEESRPGPDGEERYYTITYRPDEDVRGEIHGLVALSIDITDRRLAEIALEKKTRELARSNADLEQFAYVASHDLKAPLRAIEVLVDWLREDLEGTEIGDVQENLGLLKQRTGRLARLLDDLLAYSRAGRKVGDIRRVDTRELVQDIATLLQPEQVMRIEADDSLPTMTAFPAPLEQVLRNLINNAIKHHPTGEGYVKVSAQQRDDHVVFAVEDDGSGIPEEFKDKVFKMFQTLKPRDEVEGSGMGLAIVKRIVEWQGGRIWFQEGPDGRGTVFRFTWNQMSSELEDESGIQDYVRTIIGQDSQFSAG